MSQSDVLGQFPIPIAPDDYRLNPDEKSETLYIPFVDSLGNVVFTLPKNHKPIKKDNNPGYNFLYDSSYGTPPNYPLEAFHNEVALIASPYNGNRNLYLIDKQGKTVKDFGYDYIWISPLINNYYTAWLNRRINQEYVFLDKNGERTFGEKTFYLVRPFSEGFATVKLQKGENWEYIDETGSVVFETKEYDSRQVKNKHSFSSGYARIDVSIPNSKYDVDYLFINDKGKIVIDVQKKYEDKSIIEVGHFRDGLLNVAFSRPSDKYKDVVFINGNGEEIILLEKVKEYGYFENGMTYFTQPLENNSRKIVYYSLDKEGNTSHLPFFDDKKSIKIYNQKNYLQGWLDICESEYNCSSFCFIYQLNPSKILYLSKKGVLTYNDEYLLHIDGHLKIFTLQHIDGTVVWQTPIEERKYFSIEEALKHKDRVKDYVLTNEADFRNGLFELKNLEKLYIKVPDLRMIPKGLSKLKKLKKIEFIDMFELIVLPREITKLKELEFLHIDDCKKTKESLKYVIENTPSLKKVKLARMSIEEVFLKRLEKNKPNLEVEKLMLDIIEEYPVKRNDTEIFVPDW